MTIADAVRQIGVTEQTYYRWRKQYGGMNREQLRRLKELEKENQRLRKAVSDLTLDKMILAEAAKGNFEALRIIVSALTRCGKALVFQNAGPVVFSVNTDPHSARFHVVVQMSGS